MLFYPGRCAKDERLVELSKAVTNSGVGLIGGSCTGGLIVLGVVIYILYRLLKDDDPNERILSPTGHVPQEDSVTNQNRVPSCPRCRNVLSSPHWPNVPSCPHCRNVPSSPHCRNVLSSPPPAYEAPDFEVQEWADLPGVCMSAPPGNSKQPAI